MRIKRVYRKFLKQGGFTLLEVLIAILVLSLGLLGVAALQINALKSTSVSYQRSIATIAAQDMAERVWGYLLASEAYYGEDDIAEREIICPDNAGLQKVHAEWLVGWAPEGEESSWKLLWAEGIDNFEEVVSASGCLYTITLQWQDDRFFQNGVGDEEVSKLKYVFGLPDKRNN